LWWDLVLPQPWRAPGIEVARCLLLSGQNFWINDKISLLAHLTHTSKSRCIPTLMWTNNLLLTTTINTIHTRPLWRCFRGVLVISCSRKNWSNALIIAYWTGIVTWGKKLYHFCLYKNENLFLSISQLNRAVLYKWFSHKVFNIHSSSIKWKFNLVLLRAC